ncbi:MAG: hypothetical protein F6K17_03825 [Okeania sp. SIO3C4]|nr:hypothetical protein [Okeania sp. SIO3B3]NER01823.1 hypothetical protein [Okeania sp. SIO3C4]
MRKAHQELKLVAKKLLLEKKSESASTSLSQGEKIWDFFLGIFMRELSIFSVE